MKTNTIILTIAAAVLSLASCEQKKEPAGELKEKIDDALDHRTVILFVRIDCMWLWGKALWARQTGRFAVSYG